jgi:hypothetical protein
MRDALKEKLEASAARNQRSLSEELGYRLEMGEMIETMGIGFGRPELFWTMHLIAHAILAVERQTGKSWNEDGATRQQCRYAIASVVDNLERLPEGLPMTEGNEIGTKIGRIAT